MSQDIISVLIVDDEQEARDLLENLLSDFQEIKIVSKESNVDSAVKTIIDKTPDIIFLDIEMPGKNGFDLVYEINNFNIKTTIIFVTAYNKYAIKAFKYAAFDYFLKPVDPDVIQQTLNRYKLEKQNYNLADKIEKLKCFLQPEKIKFNTKTGFLLLNPEDIVYCEAEGNYTSMYLTNGKKEFLTKQLGQIETILPDNPFFKISRS
ncbi:MAG: LytTR family DNA-binding domain-containing protein, partial [Bacteroidales bacterium]|nr:LytTR family DNA-binding domain-containing protein [Bacteroidales bacterium]